MPGKLKDCLLFSVFSFRAAFNRFAADRVLADGRYTCRCFGGSSNGRTSDFDSENLGSNPSPPARIVFSFRFSVFGGVARGLEDVKPISPFASVISHPNRYPAIISDAENRKLKTENRT